MSTIGSITRSALAAIGSACGSGSKGLVSDLGQKVKQSYDAHRAALAAGPSAKVIDHMQMNDLSEKVFESLRLLWNRLQPSDGDVWYLTRQEHEAVAWVIERTGYTRLNSSSFCGTGSGALRFRNVELRWTDDRSKHVMHLLYYQVKPPELHEWATLQVRCINTSTATSSTPTRSTRISRSSLNWLPEHLKGYSVV